MDRQRESELFNQMADYYDKYRPGYPQEIITAIIKKANLVAGSKLLEIGAGSGKATKQFSDFGFEILCIEPGVNLVNLGNENFKGKTIKFIASRFEDYSAPSEYFDVIFSAQAFHWVDQPIGYKKCAGTIKKGGYLAPFWNIDIFNDTEIDRDLVTILDKYNGFVSCLTEENFNKRTEYITNGILESGLFSKPELTRLCWEKSYSAEEYLGYLMTSQVFIQNTDTEKQKCLEELVQFANKYNGIIKRRYTCELYLTQRL